MDDNHPITRKEFKDALAEHENNEKEEIQKFVDELLKAFPDGVDNHRRAHEKMIKAAEAEERFWVDLKADIAKKSIWGILHILSLLVVAGLAAKFGLASVFGIGGK